MNSSAPIMPFWLKHSHLVVRHLIQCQKDVQPCLNYLWVGEYGCVLYILVD